MEALPCVLTIAGSDSGGGAGIQADLKTISMMGAFGASVITALTAQNTCTVAGIEGVSPEFVALQIETVASDIKISAAKTGMLFSASIIRAVTKSLEGKDFPLVVDPVCVAQSGSRLLEEDAVEAMKEMFPLADLLTPNVPEAELFTGVEIKSREDIFRAIDILLEMGPKAVLVKGGHFDSVAATDWLGIKGQQPIPLMQQRVKCNNNHGTGCTLSAAIASGLAKGESMVTSIRHAQQYLNLALRAAYSIGEGSGPPNHLAPMLIDRLRTGLLEELHEVGLRLRDTQGLDRLIPEVRMNVALALPHASTAHDVAAFSGRITCTGKGEVIIAGQPEFGASSHMAKVLLTARKFSAEISCAANVRMTDDVLAAISECGFVQAWFDRAHEPERNKSDELATVEWGVSQALSTQDIPEEVDVVCDYGSIGREPMVRVIAKDSATLQSKLERIIKALGQS